MTNDINGGNYEPPQDDKPPSICGITSNRILHDANHGSTVRKPGMAVIHNISSPDLRLRFRHDLYLLETD